MPVGTIEEKEKRNNQKKNNTKEQKQTKEIINGILKFKHQKKETNGIRFFIKSLSVNLLWGFNIIITNN